MNMMQMQILAYDWGVRCFGAEHMENQGIRALRMAEEAIEAAQARKVDAAVLHRLIDVVYARPHGELTQELGGIMITAGVLAFSALNRSLDGLMFDELYRCLRKSPEHFAARNREKLGLGLDAGGEP